MEALLGTRTLRVLGVLAVLGAPFMFKFGMDYYEGRIVKTLEAKFAPILEEQRKFNELASTRLTEDKVKLEIIEKRLDKLEK